MSIVLLGSSSGSVTLQEPAVAGSTVINLPATSGTMALTSGSTAFTDLTVTNGATIQGLTVGRGAGAGATNTTVGASAFASNSSGTNNVAVGRFAGYSNTGSTNSFIGDSSGYWNTSGANNVGVGFAAYAANSTTATGSNNTAIGAQTLYNNTTASNNTAVGYQALYACTTGPENTAVGRAALDSLTTGQYNTALGQNAGGSITTSSGGTFIGLNAGLNTTGGNNTFVGALSSSSEGPGQYVTTGVKNTILGSYNGNQGGLDIRTASKYIVLSDGDGVPRIWHDDGGTIYVPAAYNATTASGANGFIRSDGAFLRSTSALKYKQDVRDLESIDISALRPVRYKSKCEGDDQTKDHLGVIADEAAEAGFEELITRGATGEVEGFQYERLTVVLLKELQTLRARVAQLESQGA